MCELLQRRSVTCILAIAIAFAVLGCCCPCAPTLPPALTWVVAPPDESVPVQMIAGPVAVR